MAKKTRIYRLIIYFLILAFPIYISIASTSMNTYLPIVQRYKPPTPTPTPLFHYTGNIVITNIFYAGSGIGEPDEYVQIRNNEVFSIQIENWTLSDIAHHTYTFPSFTIFPGMECRIYTNQNNPDWCGFNYGSGTAIWDNDHDCALLKNSVGALIYQYCY